MIIVEKNRKYKEMVAVKLVTISVNLCSIAVSEVYERFSVRFSVSKS